MTKLQSLTDIIARHAPNDGTFDGLLPGMKLIRSSTPTLPMPAVTACSTGAHAIGDA